MNWDKLIRVLCVIWIVGGIWVILGASRSGKIISCVFASIIVLGSIAIRSRLLIGKYIMLLYWSLNGGFGLIMVVLGKSDLITGGKSHLFPFLIMGIILSAFFAFAVFMWHPNQSKDSTLDKQKADQFFTTEKPGEL